MKVLAITGAFPYPATDGWRIRVLSLLQALARRHRLTLCSFVGDQPDPQVLEATREWFHAIHWVSRASRYGALNLLRGAVGTAPFPVLNYRSSEMTALVHRVMAADRIDAIHVVDIQMAQYADGFDRTARVLDLSNVESGLMRRFARHQKNPLTRLYALLTAQKLVRYEARVASKFSRVLTCSSDDRDLLVSGGARADITVIPNGVDTEYFAPLAARSTHPGVVFVGRMDYAPNADGVLFFHRSILPLIRAVHPDVTFTVVGQHPAPAIQALAATPGVTITGFVDDVRPYVADAAVVVVPLRFGSGTRLKILEAMAMGKAVVSTTVGCEGLRVVPGHEIVLADDPPAFADAVCRLLGSPEARSELGRQARGRAADYSWTRIGDALLRLYDGLEGDTARHPAFELDTRPHLRRRVDPAPER